MLSDDVFKQGTTIFVAFMIFNIFNYLFHFTMGRLLGPADYGVLGLLMSLNYILMAPISTIQTVIAKFTAKFRAEGQFEKIESFFVQSVKKMLILSTGIAVIFIVFSEWISDFFNIVDSKIIAVFATAFIILFTIAISRGFLQGLEKFRALSISYILEGSIKFILAVPLVYFGLRVFGAIGGIIIGAIIAFFFTLILLKRPKHFKRVDSKEIYKYAVPVLISITILTLIYNIDVLLVKHYMPEFEAGLYVALATLSKVVFWAGMAISLMMFPKIAERFAAGKEYFSIFKKSLMMVGIISAACLTVYILIPKQVVLLLYGNQYVEIAGFLFLLSASMFLLSFSYLIINYFLSINKFEFVYFLGLVLLVETALIVMYHETIKEIVTILFITNAILLLYLTADFIKNEIVPRNSGVQRRKTN